MVATGFVRSANEPYHEQDALMWEVVELTRRIGRRVRTGLHGWLIYDLSQQEVDAAHRMRAQREGAMGLKQRYRKRDSDEPWVGDAGEIAVGAWLRQSVAESLLEWVEGDPIGSPDFRVKGWEIDVKTIKRQQAPQLAWTQQVTAAQIHVPVQFYLFVSYQPAIRRAHILGAIGHEEFLARAVFCPAGTAVHARYTVPPDHEIFNIEYKHLTPPDRWLSELPD